MKRLILISLLIVLSGHNPATISLKASGIKISMAKDNSYNYAIETIKKWEAFSPIRYKLFGDTYIGYGHLLSDIDTISIVTELQADSILRSDFDKGLKYLDKICPKLPRHKKMVLGMFVFNCGIGTFIRGKLYKSIQRRDSDSTIQGLYMTYIFADDKLLPKLEQRRIDEFKIWTK